MTVHVTYNNLIFVGLRNGQVYRSVDEGITFTAVHEWSRGGYSLFWSFASDETWILIGEYGAKNDTRRVCASKDDGETWVPVYETPEAEGVHIHCVAIDPYTKGWWVSVGDYPFGRVLYSLDNGTFWQEIACPKTRRKWQPWQPLTILFFEQFILIVNDVFPQVFRMHRKTMVAEYIIDIGDFPNYAPPYSVIVGTYGIYASIVRYPEHTHDAGIFASYDKGYTWYQLVNFSKWAKTIDQSINPLMIFGAVPIVYADGYIHGTCIVGGHAFQFKDMYYVSDLQNFNRVQNFHLLQKYDTPIMNMLFKNTNSPL